MRSREEGKREEISWACRPESRMRALITIALCVLVVLIKSKSWCALGVDLIKLNSLSPMVAQE
eukprot:scaffold2112_cov85-Skeletonema_dohrnii-CCMP3373.AAC.2